ncbi:lysophospholipid acyltransferase family protein [Demequina litorisediminis]|uniref:1-acyl-sn-glycerol-3-phosphate acyltransferase n=1 Tax=Demequina litorisediminis TaxID=1849022 RepID=A0ABQ6I9D6_9MICO|nr:hypothetical protein [Demequina litorisediminis]GMA34405.1 hypothetical protein GCM10025876_06090 [Demequina litorisediminis]
MLARTGAARMALEHDVPVVPIAQWGAQHLLDPYGKRPHLIPPKKVIVRAGAPVDLEEFRGRDLDIETLRGATDRIMGSLTGMLEDIRGEKAPAKPWDMRREGAADDAGRRSRHGCLGHHVCRRVGRCWN